MATRVNGRHQSDAADFAGEPVYKVAQNPNMVAPAIDNVPEALRSQPRWVVWMYEERKGKPTKVPYDARTANRAASDDPRTWCSFDEALGALATGRWSGIGFMLGDGFVGIDLDKCRNAETGVIEPGAAQIIRDLDSYTEISPSGGGIHIIAKGNLPPGRRRMGNVEMYDAERYFTITGNIYGDQCDVAQRQAEIEVVHARVFNEATNTSQPKLLSVPSRQAHERLPSESLTLDPAANPPFEKFDLLCETEPRFRLSWDHKRTDFQDQSASVYDMSLATLAAITKWTAQEIANLLIAHRRKHREDLKLRENYYGPTIAKAMAAADKYWAEEQADEVLNDLANAPPPFPSATASEPNTAAGARPSEPTGECPVNSGEGPGPSGNEPPEARRQAILQALSTKFLVPLKRIVKYTGDPPRFRIETELGDIDLGSVRGLIYQPNLRASLAAYTGVYLPHFKEENWPAIARLLLQACEPVDRGEDATMKGTVTDWLRGYLENKPAHNSLAEADEGREPFLYDGDVHIFSNDFRRWLNMRLNERVKQDDLTANLRALGAVPALFYVQVRNKQTSRSAWKLPIGAWSQDSVPPSHNTNSKGEGDED